MEYDVRQAFADIENELLDSMMRNMKCHRAEEKKEGYEWAQWQAVQLKELDAYKRKYKKEFGSRFSEINRKIRNAILAARAEGKMAQEQEILKAVRDGAEYRRVSDKIAGEFFKVNDRKIDALVKATVQDMEKAEHAVLRMHEDKVRSAIFNAQVYANTGSGTYEKAVDMAVKDYLYAGINCVEYKNGRKVNIKDYADMALRTANKRAYLAGEGEKRKEWGVHTVIMNKRSSPCPLCLPWVGKILVDDVWSGGTRQEAERMGYPLMSHAVASGLYHPNCKDVHTTYFEGISTSPDSRWKQSELDRIKDEYGRQQKGQYAKNQAEKYSRLEEYALDDNNRKEYAHKKKKWEEQAGLCQEKVENLSRIGIIRIIGDKIMMNLQLFAEKDIQSQESASLKRSIRKFRKRIEEHEHKISHPEECFPKWNTYNIQRQEGLKKHWRKEIRNFKQSIADRIEELKKRGDYNGKDDE